MGINPVSPEATFLLITLHTGTMFAVLVYFWRAWSQHYFSNPDRRQVVARQLLAATAITGVLGLTLKYVIEKICLAGTGDAEVESLFGNLPLIASGLAAVGILILVAGGRRSPAAADAVIATPTAWWMGVMQGLALPRLFPLGQHDLDRPPPRDRAPAGGGIQLCAGGDPHAPAARPGAAAPGQGARGRGRVAPLPRHGRARADRDGLQLPRGPARPAPALPLARRRPLEVLWVLLHRRRAGGFVHFTVRILTWHGLPARVLVEHGREAHATLSKLLST